MLFEAYSTLALTAPAPRAHLFGTQVDAERKLWLSISEQAFPCLIIPAGEDDFRSDIALRSIDVEFSRHCEILADGAGEIISGTYTVVRLNDSDPDIVRLFLRLLEEAFCRGGAILDNHQVGDKILEIAELFGRLDSAPGDLIGLWGELYVIAESQNVISAARSWCSHRQAKYDFVCPEFVLEVKTTLKSVRQHRFSMEQLRPIGPFQVYIASLLLIEAPSGRKASELVEVILAQINDDGLRSAFFHRCIAKGGRDLYRSTLCLQCFPGRSSLALLRAMDIPVPQLAEGDPITQVRFDVDISTLPTVSDRLVERIMSFPAVVAN